MQEKFTNRQLQYIELIVNGGLTFKDAYHQAGYKQSKTSNIQALKLKNLPKMQEEIGKRRKEARKKNILSLTACKEILGKIINEEDTRKTTLIKAIAQLAKMSAWDTENLNINIKKDIDSMSDAELLKLIGD